ncbi:C1 family peptidase [Variovorax sp. AFSI2.2]|uniref:C1 family peptidase n=1 Tax=Variovorax sp. AFSI2.2 TaxID=3384160 RepID=UPI003EBF609A
MSDVGGIVVEADARHAWTEVRDQGARPTCIACAVSDAHAHAHGLGQPLSAEYLFYAGLKRVPSLNPAKGLTLGAADQALRSDGQPNELEWPYQTKTPSPWAPPSLTTLWYGGLDPCAAYEVVDALQAGLPVVLGLRLVPGFNRVQQSPYIIDTSGTPVGGHSVLGVGLGASIAAGAIDLLLLRNSWGFRWGFGGYAWLPLSYLTGNLIGSRTLVPLALAA